MLFFTLVGFGLRVQQLDFQPLWGDEGWSFYFASQPVLQLLALTAIDIHPPLYYVMLKGWLLWIGTGPEEARFFSVMVGVALIPVVAMLGYQLVGVRIGVVAAAIVSLTPMAVYYAQEVRMYGLVTLLGAASMYFFSKKKPGAHIVTATAALYTMYYAAFIVLVQLIFSLVVPVRSKSSFANRLKPFVIIGLLYLPWLLYAVPRLLSYIENKRNVEGYVALNLLRFLGDHFIAFSLGHISSQLQPYVWASLPMVLLAALGFGAVRWFKQDCALLLYLYLFVPLLLGYLVNLIYPFSPRFFERTLLLAAPAFWLFTAVGLVWLWTKQRFFAGIAAAAMLLPLMVSLISFYSLPRYPHEDYRPLLHDIAARALPEDTLLASYQWQLGFYNAYLPAPRPHLFEVPGWGAGWSANTTTSPQLMTDVNRILSRSPRLWFPAYQAGGHIWEDEAEAMIAQLGYPALLQWYSPQTKLSLAGAGQQPLTRVEPANFSNKLALLEASVGGSGYQAGRDIVPVELRWRKESNLGSDHRVSLRLVDASGHTWATRDSHPQAEQVFFTDLSIGNSLIDHHGLLTPAGAPPGIYRLLLSVRRVADAHPLDILDDDGQPLGAELPLADIALVAPSPPVRADAMPVQNYTHAVFDEQVVLVGYSLATGPFKSGENLPLTLFWESLIAAPTPFSVSLTLQNDTGKTIISHQKEPIWPTNQWQQGSILRDPHIIQLPATLAPGHYQLSLALIRPGPTPLSVDGTQSIDLGQVTIVGRPHVFEPPTTEINLTSNFNNQAQLIGLDLAPTQLKAGDSLPLTLYWHALNSFDKNWSVFVHLVDEQDNIWSQQDQIPGAGQFPTSGWVSGEYLIDQYNLQLPADIPPGRYHLNIGLYDVNDFSRLPLLQNDQMLSDHVALDSWPILVE